MELIIQVGYFDIAFLNASNCIVSHTYISVYFSIYYDFSVIIVHLNMFLPPEHFFWLGDYFNFILFFIIFAFLFSSFSLSGNIRVWSSESILLHTILTNKKIRRMFFEKNVLELGAGLTGLCGLGLGFSGT